MFASVLSLISPDPSPAAAAQRQIDVFSGCETNQKLILLSSVELLTVFFFSSFVCLQPECIKARVTPAGLPRALRRHLCESGAAFGGVRKIPRTLNGRRKISQLRGKKNVKRNCNQAINEGEERQSRQAAAWFFVYCLCVSSVVVKPVSHFITLFIP